MFDDKLLVKEKKTDVNNQIYFIYQKHYMLLLKLIVLHSLTLTNMPFQNPIDEIEFTG
jgi:hypothetical protein